MRRPLIGITVDQHDDSDKYESPMAYAKAVEKAGGLPVLFAYRTELELIPQLLDHVDGVLLTGGNDLDPSLYGEKWHPQAQHIDPQRQIFELALLAEVEKRAMPVLGICLGCQLMNVYRGGRLHQFLPDVSRPDALEHRKLDGKSLRHSVQIDGQSKLGSAIGATELSVNTHHKQAVQILGRGLKLVAWAPDGVVEAVEDPSAELFAAVQWHPERLHDEESQLAIFRILVDKSREWYEKRLKPSVA